MSSEVGFLNTLFPGFVCLIKVSTVTPKFDVLFGENMIGSYKENLLKFMKGGLWNI